METIVELAFLCAAAGNVARVLALPAARRELREHPALTAALGVAVIAAAGVVAAVATSSPVTLRVVVMAVAALWALLAWRARPDFGRRRGLPAGSLGLRRSLLALADPAYYRGEAASYGPVFKTAEFHRPVVCVVGLEAGRRILNDYRDSLRPAVLPTLNVAVPRGLLRYMTPQDHACYAPLFREAISAAVTSPAFEDLARSEMRHALAALAAFSARTPVGGVDPRETLDRALSQLLSRWYFGGMLHEDDPAAVDACLRDADRRMALVYAAPSAKRALRRFTELIAARSAAYDCSSDPCVWAQIVRRNPALAGDATVAGNLFHNVQDSRLNLLPFLLSLMKRIAEAPQWTARVRAGSSTTSSDGDENDDAAARAVIETLRLADEYVYREVLRPIVTGGFTVPRGWLLRICIAESHLQDPPFAQPDTFDPDRHVGRRYSANELAPFGLDAHACIAAPLSLRLGRFFAAALLSRFECRVVSGGAPARRNRHFALWEPGLDLRVAISDRGARAS